MRTRYTISFLFLLALTLVFAQEGNAENNNPVQVKVDLLVAKAANSGVARVEILNIPDEVRTPVRITPEALETTYHYKFTIRDLRGSIYAKDLREAAKLITVQPHAEIPDLRWGVIFYDLNDVRLGAVYFGKHGRRGAVDFMPVTFEGDFFKGDFFDWLDDNFSDVFR